MKYKPKYKIFCFDLDNTICKTKKSNYKKSIPIKKNIILINKLKEKGHYIKIFTSRFMGRNNESVIKAKKQGYNFTRNQLIRWNVKFDKLIFGKPSYDVFIYDKNIYYKKNWSRDIKLKYKIS